MENQISKSDLDQFGNELISKLESKIKESIEKKPKDISLGYLKTKEVLTALKIRSVNTLLKISKEYNLTRTRVAGSIYYKEEEIQALLSNGKKAR
jgi:hypothetical protein